MSSVSEYIEQHPQEVQRLVGLKYEQLEQLIKQAIRASPRCANALHNKTQSEVESRKVRIIKKAGGRQVKLSLEEQII